MAEHLKRNWGLYLLVVILGIVGIVVFQNYEKIETYLKHPHIELLSQGETRIGETYTVSYNAEGASGCLIADESNTFSIPAGNVSGSRDFALIAGGPARIFSILCEWPDGFRDMDSDFVWVKAAKDEDTAATPAATEAFVAVEAPVVTEPPVPAEVIVPADIPATTPDQAEIIDFPVPGNYDPLYNDDGDLIGITYPIQDRGPHSIPSCNKCTLIVAVGKFTFSGTIANPFTGLFGASEVTGNILAGVCDSNSGCVTPMIGAKAGHIQVTVIFPGYEIPNESVVWAVNFMFNPESSNCGDGCLEVYFGNLNTGTIKKFDKVITAPDLDLIAPNGPYSKINIVVEGTPSGSKVITNDAGDPIGQKYYLADKDAFISIPEDGGTVFYFGSVCTRDGITQNPGDVVTMYGIDTDGGTPHDQNQTVEVVCSQPEMVLVHFFHGGNFEDELQKLKNEYPDWNWP